MASLTWCFDWCLGVPFFKAPFFGLLDPVCQRAAQFWITPAYGVNATLASCPAGVMFQLAMGKPSGFYERAAPSPRWAAVPESRMLSFLRALRHLRQAFGMTCAWMPGPAKLCSFHEGQVWLHRLITRHWPWSLKRTERRLLNQQWLFNMFKQGLGPTHGQSV